MNVNVAVSMLEERICGKIEKFAPMKVVETRTRYVNWISDKTKNEMKKQRHGKAKSQAD